MVFQDPLSALTPIYTIGFQLVEALQVHQDLSGDGAEKRAVELLELVGIPNARLRVKSFPHEFSGGMRQRVMIAMAIANDPDVIIADEPTTALDVTIQAQVLDVLKLAQKETGAAVIMITHDLGVVAGIADRRPGDVRRALVETGRSTTCTTGRACRTRSACSAPVPRLDEAEKRALGADRGQPAVAGEPAAGLPVRAALPDGDRGLQRRRAGAARGRRRRATAPRASAAARSPPARSATATSTCCPRSASHRRRLPRDQRTEVSVSTGSSRSSRSPRARCSRSASAPCTPSTASTSTSGRARRSASSASPAAARPRRCCRSSTSSPSSRADRRPRQDHRGARTRAQRKAIRRDLQVVFQDPMASLDPRLPVFDVLAEPLRAHGFAKDAIGKRVDELLKLVGLEPSHANRYPQHFSGGQRQRICIARALALEPKLIVLDEPVAALDVSIQAGVINLLDQLRAELGLSYLFVAHDLAVVRHIADRVAVMYLGRIVEIGDVDSVFDTPTHPYTQALLSAVPIPDPEKERTRTRILLKGDLPSPLERPSGCRFRTRCPKFLTLTEIEQVRCIDEIRRCTMPAADHQAACHYQEVVSVF